MGTMAPISACSQVMIQTQELRSSNIPRHVPMRRLRHFARPHSTAGVGIVRRGQKKRGGRNSERVKAVARTIARGSSN